MKNIELKIDGEVIVLTSQQTEQLKRAVEKETSVPASKNYGSFIMSCKPAGTKSAYALVLSSKHLTPAAWGCSPTSYGRDFNQTELKSLITELRAYAKTIWPSFK